MTKQFTLVKPDGNLTLYYVRGRARWERTETKTGKMTFTVESPENVFKFVLLKPTEADQTLRAKDVKELSPGYVLFRNGRKISRPDFQLCKTEELPADERTARNSAVTAKTLEKLAEDRKEVSKSAPKQPNKITINDEQGNPLKTICFTREPPKVLIKPSFPQEPPKVLIINPSFPQEPPKVLTSTSLPEDRGAEVMWLFFNDRCLVGVIKLDGLPEKFKSKETCRNVWPSELISAGYCGTGERRFFGHISKMKMSDGEEVEFSAWNTTVIDFDDSLWKMPAFWKPLDEEHAQFSSEELDYIRNFTRQDENQENLQKERELRVYHEGRADSFEKQHDKLSKEIKPLLDEGLKRIVHKVWECSKPKRGHKKADADDETILREEKIYKHYEEDRLADGNLSFKQFAEDTFGDYGLDKEKMEKLSDRAQKRRKNGVLAAAQSRCRGKK